MFDDLDLVTPGKRILNLRAPAPAAEGIQDDVICTIVNGEGPTVVLNAGTHGDEYEAQLVLRQFVSQIEAEDVRGRLVIIPSINPPASQRGKRLSPIDGRNMNRTFPGKADGTCTEQLAAFLHDKVFPHADLLVDVHSGGGEYRVLPMVFGFTSDKCGIDEAGLEKILTDWGYPYIQYYVEDAPRSAAAGAAPLVGVAMVEIEGGSGGAVTQEDMLVMRDGILRGLHAYGVLAGGPAPATKPALRIDVRERNSHYAPQDGVIEHRIGLGDNVKTGDLLALLHPTHGRDAQPVEIRATGPGVILRQRATAFIRKGELVCNTGTKRESRRGAPSREEHGAGGT